MTALELARGHDGLLRGKPEPNVIVAAYLVSDQRVMLAERLLVKFVQPGYFPTVVLPIGSASIQSGFVSGGEPRVVVLALALEEDGGTDIQRAFGAVERHEALSLWDEDPRGVTLLGVRECTLDAAFDEPRRVHVILDSMEASASCKSDKWVGAAACVLRPGAEGVSLRFPFFASDGRNDWTALVAVSLSAGRSV